jgi:hypothetical protein
MKDWTGILVFIAIAIANILFEQQAQRKKRASSSPPASVPPKSRPKQAEVERASETHSSPPPKHEPTLQEVLQSLFENRNLEPRVETPPPVPKKTETPPAPAPILAKKHVPKPPAPPASPPAPPLPKPLEGATRKPASAWLAKADFHSRTSLRRAVVMAEVLGKPRGL